MLRGEYRDVSAKVPCRSDGKRVGESFKGFLGILKDDLVQWLDTSGMDLKDMVLLEQFPTTRDEGQSDGMQTYYGKSSHGNC